MLPVLNWVTSAKREATRMGDSVEKVSERVDDLANLMDVVRVEIEKPLMKSVATIATARRALSRFLYSADPIYRGVDHE